MSVPGVTLQYQQQADGMTAQALDGLMLNTASLPEAAVAMSMQNAANADAATQRSSSVAAATQLEDINTKVNLYASLNEGRGASAFILQSVERDRKRLIAGERDVRREQYRLRTQLMTYDYLRGYYRMATTFAMMTLLLTLLLLLPAALWRSGRMSGVIFFCIALVLLLAYLLLAVAGARRVAMRTPQAGWSRVDWAKPAQLKSEEKSESCPKGSEVDGTRAATTLSCTDGAERYLTTYAIPRATLPTTGADGRPIAESLRAWWHYYTHGQQVGFEWPGAGCAESITCEDATRMYMERYLGAGETSFGNNVTAWRHYLAHRDTHQWPGPSYGCM